MQKITKTELQKRVAELEMQLANSRRESNERSDEIARLKICLDDEDRRAESFSLRLQVAQNRAADNAKVGQVLVAMVVAGSTGVGDLMRALDQAIKMIGFHNTELIRKTAEPIVAEGSALAVKLVPPLKNGEDQLADLLSAIVGSAGQGRATKVGTFMDSMFGPGGRE